MIFTGTESGLYLMSNRFKKGAFLLPKFVQLTSLKLDIVTVLWAGSVTCCPSTLIMASFAEQMFTQMSGKVFFFISSLVSSCVPCNVSMSPCAVFTSDCKAATPPCNAAMLLSAASTSVCNALMSLTLCALITPALSAVAAPMVTLCAAASLCVLRVLTVTPLASAVLSHTSSPDNNTLLPSAVSCAAATSVCNAAMLLSAASTSVCKVAMSFPCSSTLNSNDTPLTPAKASVAPSPSIKPLPTSTNAVPLQRYNSFSPLFT